MSLNLSKISILTLDDPRPNFQGHPSTPSSNTFISSLMSTMTLTFDLG